MLQHEYLFLSFSCIVTGASFKYGLVVPVTIIIFINAVTFAMVVVSLSRSSLKRGKNKVSGSGEANVTTQVRIAVSCCALLGLTWIFGILAVGETALVFQYVFCILNSLQGAFIFYFNILRQPRTIEAWHGLFTGKGCRYNLTSNSSSQSSHRTNTRSTINYGNRDSASITNMDPIPLPEFRMPPPVTDKRISFVDTVACNNTEDTLPAADTKRDGGQISAIPTEESGVGKDNYNFQDGTPVASLQFKSFVEC